MSLRTGDVVVTGDGERFHLGKLLKSGGAGSVYPLVEVPTRVAKIYHDGTDHTLYERKIEAMLALSPNLPDLIEDSRRYTQIAWPQAALRDTRGDFVGFVMPAIDVQSTSELECILQDRQARAEGLPNGLGAKVTLAANLSAVIAELHRQGHHVIDLKPVNVRFYRQALYMAMLDCDGFSIHGPDERYDAQQITPDYVAPEFQNRAIPHTQAEQQDRFALAVIVFQLLNFGLHPFTGRPANDRVPTDIPGRIAGRCYAYGLAAHPDISPSPVSGHVAMPSDLRALFDSAFAGPEAQRPPASQWARALMVYAQRSNQRLVVCTQDRQHQHFVGLPCAACARGALIARTAKNAPSVRAAMASSRRVGGSVPAQTAWVPFGAASASVPQRGVPMAGHTMSPAQAAAMLQAMTASRHPLNARSVNYRGYVYGGLTCFGILLWIFLGQGGTSSPTASIVETPQEAMARYADRPSPRPVSPVPDASAQKAAIRAVTLPMASAEPRSAIDALRSLAQGTSQQAGFDYQGRRGADAYYSQGIQALQSAQRGVAQDAFALALANDPYRPESWYGYALSTTDDNDATGAFAVSELLGPDTGGSEAMRARFPYQLRLVAGIDENRFGPLETRGRAMGQWARRVSPIGRIEPVIRPGVYPRR